MCLESKVIIELNGGHHNEEEASVKDNKRAAWLSGEGYRVLRSWNNEVLTDIGSVLEEIRKVICSLPWALSPSGERENVFPLLRGGSEREGDR